MAALRKYETELPKGTVIGLFEKLEDAADYARTHEPPDGHVWAVFDRAQGRTLLNEELHAAMAIKLMRRAARVLAVQNRLRESKEYTDWLGEPSVWDHEQAGLDELNKKEKPS